MATTDRTLSKEALSPAATAHRSASMGSRMTYARLIGALFLAGFVVYGVGFGLTSSVIGAPDFLSTISAHQCALVLGAFLMLLVAPVDVGKAILFPRRTLRTGGGVLAPHQGFQPRGLRQGFPAWGLRWSRGGAR